MYFLKYVNGDYVPDTIFDKIISFIAGYPLLAFSLLFVIVFLIFKIIDLIKKGKSENQEYLTLTTKQIKKLDPELDVNSFIVECNKVFF